ncbi:DUF305 domain-containing protein [Oerskovia sp. M15]
MIRPGQPGEGNTTLQPDEYGDVGEWNEADVSFVTMMIDHHLQALDMADLATTRAADDGVTALSERIAAAQGPEIHALVAWLEARRLPVPAAAEALDGTGPRTQDLDHEDHDPEDMPGMLTDEQMVVLEGADGPDFDRLFLEGMILHHQGAVDMASTTLVDGLDLYAGELAADVVAGQAAEIGRMEEMLAACERALAAFTVRDGGPTSGFLDRPPDRQRVAQCRVEVVELGSASVPVDSRTVLKKQRADAARITSRISPSSRPRSRSSVRSDSVMAAAPLATLSARSMTARSIGESWTVSCPSAAARTASAPMWCSARIAPCAREQ